MDGLAVKSSEDTGSPNGVSIVDAAPTLSVATSPDNALATSGYEAAIRLRVPFVTDLADRSLSADFVKQVPIGFARRHKILGLSSNDDRLHVVTSDLAALNVIEALARRLRRSARVMLAPQQDIVAAINAAYQQRTGQAQEAIDKLDRRDVLAEIAASSGREDLLDTAGRAPVVKLVNLILFEAVKALASDVHVQPQEEKLIVRLRIDGILHDAFDLPKTVQEDIVGRVKVMGKMNVAEKRLAQDGRATAQVGDRSVDLRIATLPTSYGERVVIRLLDKGARLYSLTELGMDDRTLNQFRTLIRREHGIVLLTGPTGSGKTTTLYAALKEIDTRTRNVLTLEDPIEYGLEGISQTQVSDKRGMTFASGLRSVLRQDPDVIMVGEIRDRETATMAIQSALTGHLVFSTLHTNDAASAVTRLLDLGIEPYLLASSVVGVLAQRLVRRVCMKCGAPPAHAADELQRLDINSSAISTSKMSVGSGCAACRGSGYSGRVALCELLTVDSAVRHRIGQRASASQVKSAALNGGMRTLRDDGVEKVIAGITTADEVLRVTLQNESPDLHEEEHSLSEAS